MELQSTSGPIFAAARRSGSLRTPRALVIALATVLVLGIATRALAATHHFCQGNTIQAGQACTGGYTTGIYFVQTTVNHTGCAGIAPHNGGFFYPASTEDFNPLACTSGSGTAGTTINSSTGHGGTYDPNVSTADLIIDFHEDYNP